jgi:hypothetical protein
LRAGLALFWHFDDGDSDPSASYRIAGGFMVKLALHDGRLAAVVAAATLAACAGNSGGLPPSQFSPAVVAPSAKATPPACKGQTNESVYATASGVFKKRGGLICIPAFGGFGGSMAYPAAKPSVTVVSTSSTTNYNQMLQRLGHGKAVFFLQFATSGPTLFGTKLRSGGGLTGKAIEAGKRYTIYGEAKLAGVAGITVPFTPCYTVATSGKYGGVITGIGTLLEGQTGITTSATILFEIYRRKQVTTECPAS